MRNGAIAIVGASCRFPGAACLTEFWRLLRDGRDAVSEVDDRRWATRFFHHPRPGEPGRSHSWAAGLIDGVDLFDPAFFGISPREAAQMDPQQRLLLELAWHALEDAGIPAGTLAGSNTGVYVGASSTDYGDLRLGDPAGGDAHFIAGTTLSILANRVSYLFDLHGPSLTIDTACSSSLVALHHACEALQSGHIDAAIVGGVNLLLSPYPFIGFAQAGMLSRLGRCRAFDAGADGYVRAEGGAAVVLKRITDAQGGQDPIRGLILGSGVNSSGRTFGLSLPSEKAQHDLLRAVYTEAGITPDALAFFEMHGTGTPAGDPAEAAAVGTALAQARTRPLAIGSVKTNLGHLEPASGLAGLLKAVLALEHGIVPGSLHCDTPNPAIPFDRLNLRVVRAAETIASTAGICAGVNSFGFGGVNAHAIVAAAPPTPTGERASPEILPPLLISARSEAALRALVLEWRQTLASATPDRAPALLRAAARQRDHHGDRLVVLGASLSAIDRALADHAAGLTSPAVIAGTAQREPRLAFVYSGNGAQWPEMGREAYREDPDFRAAVDAAARAMLPSLGWSVAERIAGGIDATLLRRTDIAQPVLFAIQVAITMTLRNLGIAAVGYAGHSVGEIAAAWAAAALSLDDAARIIAVRSRHQQRVQGAGAMAALALSAEAATSLIAESGLDIELAAINSPRSVTVSGSAAVVADLTAKADRLGIAWQPLDLDFAFHSRLMEPIRDGLRSELGAIASRRPKGIFASTVTGRLIGKRPLGAPHWWRNIREPVRFAAAIEALLAAQCNVFVEIGPTPVLTSYLRDILRKAATPGAVLASLSRRRPSGEGFAHIAARLHVAGADIDKTRWFDGPADPRGLPLYPWQRRRHWFPRTAEAADPVNPICDHPLLGFRRDQGAPGWVNHVDLALFPWLADHRVGGNAILPGAAVVDMALAAARALRPDAPVLTIADVELRHPLRLETDRSLELRCTVTSLDDDWQLRSRRRLADEPMTVNAVARITATDTGAVMPRPTPNAAPIRIVDAATLYRRAARCGLDYGSGFRSVTEVAVAGADHALATLVLPGDAVPGDFVIHPVLLDGALQALLALIGDDAPPFGSTLLPWRFGEVAVFPPFGRVAHRAELRLRRHGVNTAAADVALFDRDGAPVALLRECWFRRARLAETRIAPNRLVRTELRPAPLTAASAPPVLGRIDAIAAEAAAARPVCPDRREQGLLLAALVAATARERPEPGDPIARQRRRRLADGVEYLPPATELWRSLLAEAPDLVAELAAVAALACGDAAVSARSPLLTQLRQSSPAALAAADTLADVIGRIAAEWPSDRPQRLLAIGSDGLADRLTRCFDRTGVRVSPAAEQGTDEVDVIAWLNAGPASGIDGALPLIGLRERLADGGCVVAVEPAPSPIWELAAGEPLRSAEQWQHAFRVAGFAEAGACRIAAGPWPSLLLWARAKAAPPQTEALQTEALASAMPVLALFGDTAEIAEALRAGRVRVASAIAKAAAAVFAVDGADDPLSAIAARTPDFVQVARHAAAHGIPLWLVTTGAHQGTKRDLPGAALAGLGRVLVNEIAGLDLRRLDLPSAMPPAQRAARLVDELRAAGPEREIVWTAAGRQVARLRRGLPPRRTGQDEAVTLVCNPAAGPNLPVWQSLKCRTPGSGEIAIDVAAAALNFRDVMRTTGLLPEEALLDGFAGPALGLECAGTVAAAGPGVEGLAVGDRVAGFAASALSSCVVTRADAVMTIPRALGFPAAATLPVAFVTAFYALETLARLQPGETALIHSAGGGVGLAALQYAKTHGAVVIATAGSETKRAFLRHAGADHVFDSRSLGFVEAVRSVTGGAGVDVVLNALSGEAMAASLDLLKPFGRFVELGKRDFHENRRLRLRPLRHNISYFAADIDQLAAERPALARALLERVATALSTGTIRPLAHRTVAFADAAAAFREMQAARHIGKLVLVPDGQDTVPLGPASEPVYAGDGAFVVTGGLEGFGFASAEWLARHGVRSLALLGRRGRATPGAAERIAALEDDGVTVATYAVDVGDRAALSGALADIRRAVGPIRGVVHAAAAAAADAMAEHITAEAVAAGLRAKLGGALLLDELTRGDPVELFLLCSSATTLVGAPGQGIYVAANAALEALARRRHAEGLPALAVAWGPIADVGRLARDPELRERLTRRLGAAAMPAATALAHLAEMLASGLPVVGFADLAGGPIALPLLASPIFDDIRAAADPAVPTPIDIADFAGLDAEAARALIETIVAEAAAGVLRLPVAELDPLRPLAELGMDSLMAVELRLALESRLRLDVPVAVVDESTTVAGLAAHLAASIARADDIADTAGLIRRHERIGILKSAAE